MDGIGNRVRELRQNNEMTLQDLGKLAGLSGSFLSQLERGASAVSILALKNICQALRVSLSEFFVGVEDIVPSELKTQAPESALNKDVVINATEGSIRYTFISRDAPGKLEVNVGHFTSQDQLPLSSHEGEEYGYVLQGILRLTIAGEQYVLHSGNTYHFPSATPHKYEAVGDQEVTVLWVKLL